jgi:hypothetical protein
MRELALSLLFALAAPAAAQDDGDEADEPFRLPVLGETTLSLTSTTIVEYRANNLDANDFNDDFLSFTEKLDLLAQGEEVALFFRLDGFLPILTTDCAEGFEESCLDGDVRPERFGLRYDGDELSLEVGDGYAVFGRGIALTFRKVDLLGVDTTVRGAHLRYEGRRVFFHLLGGLANPQNLDPAALTVTGDPDDFLVGARAGVRIGEDDDLVLALHGARVWFEEEETGLVGLDNEVTATVFGWSAELPALLDGRLSLYAEANGMIRDTTGLLGDVLRPGRAIYAAVQLQQDRVSLLVEWKDYRSFLLAPDNRSPLSRVYSAAPSLDLDTERYRGVHNSRGGSALFTYAFSPGPWSASVGGIFYGHEDEDDSIDPWDGILVTHGYATVRRDNDATGEDELGWSLDVSGGYRQETYIDPPEFPEGLEQGDLDWRVIHAQAELVLAFGEHAFDLLVDHRFEERGLLFDNIDYVRGGFSLTYTFRGTLTVSSILRWDTEKADAEIRRNRYELPGLYPGAEVKWEFRAGSHLRVFGGRTPGGRICSGGVCRDVPAFEGVLGELVLRL